MIPAEYISNVIYEGPRADSLYAADQRLRQLADSVRTTAESLNTTLDELHENWKGSSSEWMADAALRYLDWLSKHSRQILRTENIQAMDRYLSWTRFALSKLPRWREPPQIHRSG